MKLYNSHFGKYWESSKSVQCNWLHCVKRGNGFQFDMPFDRTTCFHTIPRSLAAGIHIAVKVA